MAHRAADRRLPHAGIGLSPVITSGIAQQALVAAVALHFTVALHAHEMTETTPTDVELAIHSDRFQLVAPYQPAGDQPQAIRKLVAGFENGLAKQVLLGLTPFSFPIKIDSMRENISSKKLENRIKKMQEQLNKK